MNEITIAVKYDNDNPTVSGRELHAALEVRTQYSIWFDRMCEYGFSEGIDYYSFLNNRSDGLAGKPRTDHQLTIDMAKELCMIQRTEIGKRCREYFLNLEKQWNSPDAVMARALQIADQKLELANQQNNNLIETTAVQAKQIEVMKPKADYCDMVLQSEGLMTISTIAKDYGKSAIWLNKWLHEHGIQYKQGQIWPLLRFTKLYMFVPLWGSRSTSSVSLRLKMQKCIEKSLLYLVSLMVSSSSTVSFCRRRKLR